MASVAMLPARTIKEEPGLLQRPILPKRRNGMSSVPTRVRFAKPRPNITAASVNKLKDTPSEEKRSETALKPVKPQPDVEKPLEKTSVAEKLVEAELMVEKPAKTESVFKKPVGAEHITEKPIAVEPVTEKAERNVQPRPSLTKRSTGVPNALRARFQKARPNISALMSKASTDTDTQGKKSLVPSTNSNIDQSLSASTASPEKESSSSLDKAARPETEITLKEKKSDDVCKVDSFARLKVTNHHHKTVPNISVTSMRPEVTDSNCPQALTECEDATPALEKNLNLDIISEKELPVLPFDKSSSIEIEKAATTSPKSITEAVVQKESPPTAPLVIKNTEYPTLKSILNSPRKRVTTKKAHERRKRFANVTETPPRSEMTMLDLIYWNPSGSPMKSTKPQSNSLEVALPSEENSIVPAAQEDEENVDNTFSSTPKVIINENGEIIIDESSLLIKRKDTIDQSIAAIVENDNTTYSSFRKRSAKQWSTRETAKFYKALSLVGTDFALMENIFTVDGKVTRTRRELKLKFKREEKVNTQLVYRAMYESQTYDVSILDDDPDDIMGVPIEDTPPRKNKKEDKLTKKKNVEDKTDETGVNHVDNTVVDRNDIVIIKKKRGRKKKVKNVEEVTEDTPDLPERDLCDENDSEYLDGEQRSSVQSAALPDDNIYSFFKNREARSRSGRIRKVKIMADYVTDVYSMSDSDESYQVLEEDCTDSNATVCTEYSHDEIDTAMGRMIFVSELTSEDGLSPVVRMGKRKFISNLISSPESEAGMNHALKKKKMKNVSEEEANAAICSKEISTSPPVKKQKGNSCATLKPQTYNITLENSDDSEELLDVVCLAAPNSQSNILTEETTENSHIDNLLILSDSSACKDFENANILTNAAISEVITSEKVQKKAKKRSVPTIINKGTNSRHKPKLPNPSFAKFTPIEEDVGTRTSSHSNIPKALTRKMRMNMRGRSHASNDCNSVAFLEIPLSERCDVTTIKTYLKNHSEFSTPKTHTGMTFSCEELEHTPEQFTKVPQNAPSPLLQTSLDVPHGEPIDMLFTASRHEIDLPIGIVENPDIDSLLRMTDSSARMGFKDHVTEAAVSDVIAAAEVKKIKREPLPFVVNDGIEFTQVQHPTTSEQFVNPTFTNIVPIENLTISSPACSNIPEVQTSKTNTEQQMHMADLKTATSNVHSISPLQERFCVSKSDVSSPCLEVPPEKHCELSPVNAYSKNRAEFSTPKSVFTSSIEESNLNIPENLIVGLHKNHKLEHLTEASQNKHSNPLQTSISSSQDELISVPITKNNAENVISVDTIENSFIDNLQNSSDTYAYRTFDNSNILTDATITEVVTSDKIKKRIRRKPAPTIVTKGIKRSRTEAISQKASRLYNPSFTNFTPCATEEDVTSSLTFSNISTNSPKALSPKLPVAEQFISPDLRATAKQATSLYQGISLSNGVVYGSDSDPLVEECTEESESIQTRSQNCIEFSTPKISAGIVSSLEEPMYTPERLAKLPQSEHSTLLQTSLNVSKKEPVSISVSPEYSAESPPVMIFTKSANNDNILHLFVVKNPIESNCSSP